MGVLGGVEGGVVKGMREGRERQRGKFRKGKNRVIARMKDKKSSGDR